MEQAFNEVLQVAMSYPAYEELVSKLVSEGKTSGPHQSDKLIGYTRLNLQRMQRLAKKASITPELANIVTSLPFGIIAVALTEAWCGDAAQNLPYFHALEKVAPNFSLFLLLRDEHPHIMDKYLTSGSRSIPKVVLLHNETFSELGIWGPRPCTAQQMVMDYKAQLSHIKNLENLALSIHSWYAKNKGTEINSELFGTFTQIKEMQLV